MNHGESNGSAMDAPLHPSEQVAGSRHGYHRDESDSYCWIFQGGCQGRTEQKIWERLRGRN